jgi:hypothetical protein
MTSHRIQSVLTFPTKSVDIIWYEQIREKAKAVMTTADGTASVAALAPAARSVVERHSIDYTTFMALHASQGPHLGLPQMLQSRAQFGYRGVVVPLLAPLSWRGILAYVLGLASIVPFANLTFFQGPAVAALNGVDISWVVGIVVTSAVYFGVTRSLDLSKDEQAISESQAELQALGLAAQAAGPAGSAEAAPAQRF